MLSLTRGELNHIQLAISKAIGDAFSDLKQHEPQLIANLVWHLPNKINQVKLSGANKLLASGVFVHAQPFVTYNPFPDPSQKSIEIGDLLLIRELVQGKTVIERRALLLQAKKINKIPAIPDNPNQWRLYAQWPPFIYAAKSGNLTGKGRYINGPDMYDAAKYLLLNTSGYCHPNICHACRLLWCHHFPDVCAYYTAQPTEPSISRYRVFADELFDFLLGNAGKIFIQPHPGTIGWDQVINDLIEETARMKTVYIQRATEMVGASRGNLGHLMISTPSHLNFFDTSEINEADFGQQPPEVPQEPGQSEEGGGISIIKVVVEQGDNPN
jgi:hypothetical protein